MKINYQNLEKKIKISFKDKSLLVKSLTHKSYDKKNNKTIYGTTTAEERDEIADEGIDLISVPWIEKDN